MDIGCGTGTLVLKAAEKGAEVKGIDVNPQMLEIAKKRIEEAKIGVELQEMGVAELGTEEAESYDVVMATLCFSELTEDELRYTLKEVKRMLKPGRYLLVADEMVPKSIPKMIFNWLIRVPLSLITYLITQTTTHAVKNLPEKIKEAGLQIDMIRSNKMENFIELVARKPGGRPK